MMAMTDPNDERLEVHSDRSHSTSLSRRNLLSFWIFGLCNNFAYVVMLSAAHDILDEENSESSSGNSSVTVSPPTTTTAAAANSSFLQCNPVSTGAILLADILPTLIVKMIFPLFLEKIPFSVKITLVSAFALSSFLVVALAHEIWLSIIGVVCASIGAGLGEITFLGLTTFYHRNSVSMWSSGTGGAGVFGALVYAGFTTAGLSPRNSLLIMVVIPVMMILTYFFVLQKPKVPEKKSDDADDTALLLEERKTKKSALTLKQKMLIIPSLFKYMIPLTLVYFAEYFINQGLHELLYFNGEWLSKSEQYRWYQVDYQIGVFISRSSVNLIHIKKLWILPVLQLVNLALLIFQVFYRFIPNIWIVFIIILWEGLLGGAAYVNTFFRLSNELPPDHKEYSISIVALGDSVGIAVAGATAIPSHKAICDLNLKM